MKYTAREIAFLALVRYHEHGTFLWDSIQKWKEGTLPQKCDIDFAYELACGTCRKIRWLDYVARLLSKKLPAKPKERYLLRLALYQRFFLPNIPLYAVVDTTVTISKKYCHSTFTAFLNAFLRKDLKIPPLDTDNLGILYSYPDYFVSQLVPQYGEETARQILEQENLPTPTTSIQYNENTYIQNRTQYELISQLAQRLCTPPTRILDMCAAPGGKTLALSHFFPNASLVANDKSSHKIQMLRENLARFSCPAEITNKRAQDLDFPTKFDLIVVDAPCSNSGVLYKCPEARWRLCEESITSHTALQKELLQHAVRLACPTATIWYMTCSILAQENELLVKNFCTDSSLKLDHAILQLPDNEGHEGGFACQITILN